MSSAEIHREPFIHLVDLARDRALIAWGAFYFERTERSRWEIVDDEQRQAGRAAARASGRRPSRSATRPSRSSRQTERLPPRPPPTNARGCGCRVSSPRPTTATASRSTVRSGPPGSCGTGS